MKDTQTSLAIIKKMVHAFVHEREWNQFHNPKSLSMNIAVEAAELMELFIWCTTEGSYDVLNAKRSDVEDELADVFMGLIAFVNAVDIDLAEAFAKKLEKTKQKYPIEKVRGKSEKYTEYVE
jgi:dCTP diphosphatase